MTDARHLLWLDADDVLADDADMRALAEGPRAAALLGLCELWGDLSHTTQRLSHVDCCHVYIDRRGAPGLHWGGGGGTAARPVDGPHAGRLRGAQAFHLKGVKPDKRIAARGIYRAWLSGNKGKGLPADVHRAALRTLLHSRQDRIQGTYLGDAHAGPKRPAVIRNALPGRFQMVYQGAKLVDRVDLYNR